MVLAMLFPLADKTRRQLPWHAQRALSQSGKEPSMSSGTVSPHTLSSESHASACNKTTASDDNPEFADTAPPPLEVSDEPAKKRLKVKA